MSVRLNFYFIDRTVEGRGVRRCLRIFRVSVGFWFSKSF